VINYGFAVKLSRELDRVKERGSTCESKINKRIWGLGLGFAAKEKG
jgi:hypothetical protein